MTKDEALKLALEALEQHGTPFLHHEDAYSNSLNALRQAIADAEKQEPDDLTIAYMAGFYDGKNKNAPQPKPLTDEQLIAAYESEQQGRYGDHIRSLRAIEAKLREKNGG